MICPQCGKENADGSRFCGTCGGRLPDDDTQQFSGSDQQGNAAPASSQQPHPGYQQPAPSQQTGQYPPQYQQGQYQQNQGHYPPYQGPQYQQTPYGNPPPYQQFTPDQRGYYSGQPMPYSAPAYVPSHLGWAIAVLILCFWPTGIVAVVYASQVGNRLRMGDYFGAKEASHKAKIWSWVSVAIGIAWIIVVILWLIFWAGVYVTTSVGGGVIY